jgi:glycosyltransferase involved in cell wall biosynthesis
MKSACRKIVILDDCSTDNTPEICAKYGDVYPSDRSYWGTDELKQRKFLWYLVTKEAEPGEWILCLDADETIPLYELLPDITEKVDSINCDGIGFRLYDMWNETHYRDDEWWRGHKGSWTMLVKYDPGKQYVWCETPLHCGRFPKNAVDRLAQTEVAVQHWGWSRPEDREVKYRRYMKVDPVGEWGFIEQYLSILDPDPKLVKFEVKIQ